MSSRIQEPTVARQASSRVAVARRRLEELEEGQDIVVSFPGTSQYEQGGPASCAHAAMNFTKVVLENVESLNGAAFLSDLIGSDILLRDITAICATQASSSSYHSCIDDIAEWEVFRVSMNLQSVQIGLANEHGFARLLRELEMQAGHAVCVITRTPEIIAVAKIICHGKPVFVNFDSHPRPAHPNGAGLTLSTSARAVVANLSSLFYYDPSILVDISLSDAEKLMTYSAHIFTVKSDDSASSQCSALPVLTVYPSPSGAGSSSSRSSSRASRLSSSRSSPITSPANSPAMSGVPPSRDFLLPPSVPNTPLRVPLPPSTTNSRPGSQMPSPSMSMNLQFETIQDRFNPGRSPQEEAEDFDLQEALIRSVSPQVNSLLPSVSNSSPIIINSPIHRSTASSPLMAPQSLDDAHLDDDLLMMHNFSESSLNANYRPGDEFDADMAFALHLSLNESDPSLSHNLLGLSEYADVFHDNHPSVSYRPSSVQAPFQGEMERLSVRLGRYIPRDCETCGDRFKTVPEVHLASCGHIVCSSCDRQQKDLRNPQACPCCVLALEHLTHYAR